MPGRKVYQPTDKDRGIVRAMAAYGVPQEDIGKVVGVSHVTLRKYFERELETAALEANAKVAETCYSMATSGNVPAATFFWLKTRAGWRETNNLDHSGTITVTDDASHKDEFTRRIDSIVARLSAGSVLPNAD